MEPQYAERNNGLTPEEFAILSFTNDGEHDQIRFPESFFDYPSRVVLTGKEGYFWAVALTIAFSRLDHITEESIYKAYERAVSKNVDLLRKKYCSPSLDYDSDTLDRAIFEQLVTDFLAELDCSEIELKEIIKKTQIAFDSLIAKGLIEDPLEIAAGIVTLGVLGFVPYGFTTKTRKGRVVYRKVTAGYWTYERRVQNGIDAKHFNFRLAKLLSAFKRALIEVSQEGVDDPER